MCSQTGSMHRLVQDESPRPPANINQSNSTQPPNPSCLFAHSRCTQQSKRRGAAMSVLPQTFSRKAIRLPSLTRRAAPYARPSLHTLILALVAIASVPPRADKRCPHPPPPLHRRLPQLHRPRRRRNPPPRCRSPPPSAQPALRHSFRPIFLPRVRRRNHAPSSRPAQRRLRRPRPHRHRKPSPHPAHPSPHLQRRRQLHPALRHLLHHHPAGLGRPAGRRIRQ